MTAAANSPLNRLVEARPERGPPAAGTEQVETDTIDHFCHERQIERIDILKVDAEGADLKRAAGRGANAARGQGAFVFAEVGFDPE